MFIVASHFTKVRMTLVAGVAKRVPCQAGLLRQAGLGAVASCVVGEVLVLSATGINRCYDRTQPGYRLAVGSLWLDCIRSI